MKRKFLSIRKSSSLAMLTSLLMSTFAPIASVPVSAAVPTTVHFTGQPAEWASIPHDSVTAGSSLEMIKATQSGGKLHILVKGTNVSNQGTFYIDADNNPATGELVTGWKNSGGIDYKITGDKLYQFSSGAWTQIGTVPYANTGAIAEAEVDIAQLGLSASAPMKVAYSQSGFNAFLPDAGKDMLSVDTEVPAFGPDANITVDANTEDWAGLQPIATTGGSVTTSVYAVMNNERLSILVTGKVGDWNDIFVDTDNSKDTGFLAPHLWPKQGFDYLIENGADGAVYKSLGAGWAWDKVAGLTEDGVQYADSGTNDNKTIEISVPISKIGLTAPRTLYVGFDGGGQRAPIVPGAAAKVIPALPKITVDANDADWAGIAPLAAGTGNIVDFSALVKDKKVYAFTHYHGDVSLSTNFKNLFIDSDNNTSTGYQVFGQNPATGSDYMVQGSKLYKYNGTNGGWGWTSIGTAPVQSVMSATYAPSGYSNLEMAVDLSSFNDVTDKINVGLNIGPTVGSDYAPAAGTKYPMALSATNGVTMTVDGQESDWSAIDNKSLATSTSMTLNAVQDDNKLYLLTQGANLNSQNEYFIDSDNNAQTGYHDTRWTNAGIDYKVSYNTLYHFDGTNWVKVGSVNSEITSTTSRVYLYLDQLGLSAPGQFKVAYVSKNAAALPEAGAAMLNVSSLVHQDVTAGVYYPRENFDVLHNPFMGFMPWANGVSTGTGPALKNTPYPQDVKILYAGIQWKDLEPTKGNFDWAGIEATNQLDYWYSLGAKVNLRIVMDTPGSVAHRDIPDWLYDEIVAEQGVANAGTNYGPGSSRQGFAPNYSSPILIQEHARLIQAFAERYDNDPRVSYIQIGSLGHWGEFHNTYVPTPPGGTPGNFPKVSVSDQYVQHYINNFHNKLIGMRKPFPIAASNKLGLFNDIIGDKGSTEVWKDWTVNGWGDVGLFLEPGQNAAAAKAASAMPDFWKTSFSGGEFTSNISLPNHFTDDYIIEQLSEVRYSHTSWVGPNSPSKFVVGENGVTQNVQENLDSWMKTVGYRYVLESVSHPAQAAAGDAVSIATHWNNKGVAPFYYNWPVAVALADASGNIVASSVTKATQTDIRSWLPGGNDANLPLQIPADLASGTYKVLISMIDPDTNKPGIDLAIAGKRSDGWYALDQIQVSNTSIPTTGSVVLTGPNSVTSSGSVALQFGVTGVQHVAAQDVVLSYDATKFTFDRATSLDGISTVDVSNDATTGTLHMVVVHPGAANALDGDHPAILQVNFMPVANASGIGSFTVQQAILSDGDGNKTNAAVAEAEVSVAIINAAALTTAISTAEAKLATATAGTAIGDYPANAISALQTALSAAQGVAADSEATQSQLNDAASALNTAIAVFDGFVITSQTGDLNSDNAIDISDIGIIAGHYGMKSTDSGWNVKWDLDGNGEVGLYELAFVVRRLLNH